MTITILGTGTSCGVPVVGCQCDVCQSTHPKDKRLRCSILVETEQTRLLIDAGPDFRQQMLTQPFRRIDGILVTHSHYDHVGGMDDIRPYCQFGKMEVYADAIARQGMLEMLRIAILVCRRLVLMRFVQAKLSPLATSRCFPCK